MHDLRLWGSTTLKDGSTILLRQDWHEAWQPTRQRGFRVSRGAAGMGWSCHDGEMNRPRLRWLSAWGRREDLDLLTSEIESNP